MSFPQSYTGFEIDIYSQNKGYGLTDSIKVIGKLFGYMIKILKDEDTVLADNAA